MHPTTNKLYLGIIAGNHVLFLCQVDDFAFACEHKSTTNILLDMLDNELMIPLKQMGLLDMYNGLDVIQTKDFIKITCTTYIECISAKHLASWMKNFDVPTGRPTLLPGEESFMRSFLTATVDPNPKEQDRLSKAMVFGYCLGIKELIYSLVTCHLDLLYAIVRCTQSSMCPAEIHYHAVKHILKYLYLTWYDGLHYWHPQPNESLPPADLLEINSKAHDLLLDGRPVHDSLDLHGYVDSGWATCPKTRPAFTGVRVCLAGGTIAYKSKIQPTIAQSSTEAKFMGASDFGWLILFIWIVLWDIGVPQEATSILYEDNNACIVMAMSQKPTPHTQHMDIKYHALCKWVERDLLKLERIDTMINLADHLPNNLDGFSSIVMWIISLGKYLLYTALPLLDSPSTHT
jgi:hypothetical protein